MRAERTRQGRDQALTKPRTLKDTLKSGFLHEGYNKTQAERLAEIVSDGLKSKSPDQGKIKAEASQ